MIPPACVGFERCEGGESEHNPWLLIRSHITFTTMVLLLQYYGLTSYGKQSSFAVLSVLLVTDMVHFYSYD